jgi:UDP-N-acetylmuramoyl-L-alanyl-D-glutamate--2,6-diaminopimelate ligase
MEATAAADADAARLEPEGAAPEGGAELDLWAEEIELAWSGTSFGLGARGALGEALAQAGLRSLSVPAIGEIYAENALGALAAAIAAGVDARGAADAIAAAPPPPGRFELLATTPRVVLDYAHSPDALWRTLDTARRLCRGELWVVFGAGGNRDRDKRLPMGHAARAADHVLLTSDNPRDEDPAAIAHALRQGLGPHPSVRVELDRKTAITCAVLGAGVEDVVVVAGKGHETEQEIGGERRAFSDRLVVADACHKRNATHASLQ